MDIIRFDRWIRCVIRNKCYSYFRKENRYYSRNVSYGLYEEGWNDKYFVTQFSVEDFSVEVSDGKLLSCINRLGEKQKSIVMLHYFVGYTDKETGEILKLPRTTVHYNRKQSLLKLRKDMGKC